MIKLTRKEIVDIYNKLPSFNNYKGLKFAYFINKLSLVLKDEVEIINKFKYVEGFLDKYSKVKNDLLYKYGVKHPDGSLLFSNKNTQEVAIDPEKAEDYKESIKVLEEEQKDLIEAQKAREKEYLIFIQEDFSTEFPSIKLEDVPEEIRVEDFAYISKFIEN